MILWFHTNITCKFSLFSSLFCTTESVDLCRGNLHKRSLNLCCTEILSLLQYNETTMQAKQERVGENLGILHNVNNCVLKKKKVNVMAEWLKPNLLLFLGVKGFPAARPAESKLEMLLSCCNVHQQLCVLITEELSLLKTHVVSPFDFSL